MTMGSVSIEPPRSFFCPSKVFSIWSRKRAAVPPAESNCCRRNAIEREVDVLDLAALRALDLDGGVDAAVDAIELVDEEVRVAEREVFEEGALVLRVDAFDFEHAVGEHRREKPIGCCVLKRRKLPFVVAGEALEPDALARVSERRLEAVSGDECRATLRRQRPSRELRELDLPLDARPAVPARDSEVVVGPVGQRADVQQREEPVALQHRAPLDRSAVKVVGARLDRRLPTGSQQLLELAAGLRQASVGEDPLLAHLHSANETLENRWAADRLAHGRAERVEPLPRDA